MWHFNLCVFLVVALSNSIIIQPIRVSFRVARYMKDFKIVPNIIPVPPRLLLQVHYLEEHVALGNLIKPINARKMPLVIFRDADPVSYYTLCMIDADAPNCLSPLEGEWQNWLVVNIPGFHVDKGETLTEYVGARPLPNTGYHRYVLLVYKQPAKLIFTERRLDQKYFVMRSNFSITEFAYKYRLGKPISGNFFRSIYDYTEENRYYR